MTQNGENADLAADLTRLRISGRRNQSWMATKIGLDNARISRWESGELRPSNANVTAFCKVLGTPLAKAYLRYFREKWRFLSKPSFWHPNIDGLRIAEDCLSELDDFTSRLDALPTLKGEVEMHRATVMRSAVYLASLEHRIALVGEIAVGKSTAICVIADLMLQDRAAASLRSRTALQTGSGRTTLCDVCVTSGPKLGIVIEPQTDEEVFTLVGELCSSAFLKGSADTNKAGDGITEELDRALRAMAGLSIEPVLGKGGKSAPYDPLVELRRKLFTLDELRAEFLARMQLSKRTVRQIWYTGADDAIDLEWLKKTFAEVNGGRRADVTLPKRIDVILPRNPLDDIDDARPFGISLVDTKGLDESAVRRDIADILRDARTLTLLCTSFGNAPGSAIQRLLERSEELGVRHALLERAALLVLAQPGQAVGMLPDDDAGGDQLGYALKEQQITSALDRIGVQLPTLFFNAASDDRVTTCKQIVGLLSGMRSREVARLQSAREAIRAMKDNVGRAVAAANRKEVLRRLRIEFESNHQLPARIRPAYDLLLREIQTRHARTVWASTRRSGSYWNFDVYFYLGSGAVTDAQLRSKQAIESFDGVMRHLLNDEQFKTAHDFVRELQANLSVWNQKFLDAVRRIGEEVYKPALKENYELWDKCLASWGTGFGNYRGGIADELRRWFEESARNSLSAHLDNCVNRAWNEEVVSPLNTVCAIS
jgi:transcriptional regulator with XRE-family HTH domain